MGIAFSALRMTYAHDLRSRILHGRDARGRVQRASRVSLSSHLRAGTGLALIAPW